MIYSAICKYLFICPLAHQDISLSVRYWDKINLNMVFKIKEANQPNVHKLSCTRPPERASQSMQLQLEASESTTNGRKKSLSNEEIATELKKLVSSCLVHLALCQFQFTITV